MGNGTSTSTPNEKNQQQQPVAGSEKDAWKKDTKDFRYYKGTCALEYWEPIKLLGEGSISSIHLVRRRPSRVHIPYRERADIMNSCKVSTCSVEKGCRMDDLNNDDGAEDEYFVLKSIIKAHVRNDRFLQEMRNEIYTMSHLDHPNIIRVYEAYERKRHIYLIMEYCGGGDLNGRSFTEAQAARIVSCLLEAVSYLHAHNVVHRDLKLENVLLGSDDDGAAVVKIIDFGLATRYLSDEHKKMRARVGTLYSMAPQVLQGVYTSKCDLWSIGVVTYILLSGLQPFWGPPREMSWEKRKKIMIDRILRCEYMRMTGPSWEHITDEAKQFVQSLLQLDPDDRPDAQQALQSTWLQNNKNKETLNYTRQDSLYRRMVEFRGRTRACLVTCMSEEEVIALDQQFERYDPRGEGKILLRDFQSALKEVAGNKIDCNQLLEDSNILTTNDDKNEVYIEYADLFGDILESQLRADIESLAVILEDLDEKHGGTGKVPLAELKSYLQDRTSDRILASVERDADNDGMVNVWYVLESVVKSNSEHIDSVLNSTRKGDVAEDDSINLVDEKHAVIPGGHNDPSEIPTHVYDPHSHTLRRIEI